MWFRNKMNEITVWRCIVLCVEIVASLVQQVNIYDLMYQQLHHICFGKKIRVKVHVYSTRVNSVSLCAQRIQKHWPVLEKDA